MTEQDGAGAAFSIDLPEILTSPLVVASPHSGTCYPADLIAASHLDMRGLRRSEDSFVDELCAAAPTVGAPLLRALIARVYVDLNREAWELDPGMFEDRLPHWVNCRSPRVANGLGTLARVVADGRTIYRRKLTFAEARDRVERIHMPYHRTLESLLATTQEKFGMSVLLDMHSMPSGGVSGSERQKADFVLGDRYGTSCAAILTDAAEAFLRGRGYRVVRNVPYAGGYTTVYYGTRTQGRHALQIEINRALYMDEERFEKKPGFAALALEMTGLLEQLGKAAAESLMPA